MRALLGLVLLAASGWSGYWYLGAQAQEQAVEIWLIERRNEGWQVEYSDVATRGFPNRFDLTLRDLVLTDPETGLSWTAPFFQLLALSYRPHHLIAVWPNTQTIATPYQRIAIETGRMTASLVVKANATLELDRSTLSVEQAVLTSSEGWTTGFEKLSAAIRETVGVPLSYDVAVTADALRPGALLDQKGDLPDQLEAVRLDTVITFERPLDITTIEDSRPDITRLEIKDAHADWGELALRAAGSVTVDQDGYPDGRIDVNARQWREMLALAVQAGAIPAEAEGAVELGLGLLARMSGNSESIDAPLTFSNGRSFLGPIPIGEAPRINIR